MKVGKEILMFGDIKIEKHKFHRYKIPVLMYMLRTYQYITRFLLVTENYGYFIGYLDGDYEIKSLYIMLPKTSTYLKRMQIP